MLEDTATTEESTTNEETEIDEPVLSAHPYDLPGEWFVLNAQSLVQKSNFAKFDEVAPHTRELKHCELDHDSTSGGGGCAS